MKLRNRKFWFSIIFCSFSPIAPSITPSIAQIVPDATLPVNSTVKVSGKNSSIEGGTTAGSNLFHSFREFSVLTGNTAVFNNSADIQNIFTRITGGSISNIDGELKANGTANLFLLNPNGIIFGPNASLNIGGSFLATTANAVDFGGGANFSATFPRQNTPLLIVSVPLGLQYGQPSGSIVNRSTDGLQVRSGKSLILAGGDVRLEGGVLVAPGGRVELAAVAGSGTVPLNFLGNNVSLVFPTGIERGDISLTKEAGINVRAAGGGNVIVNAHNFNASEGSKVRAGINEGLGAAGARSGDIYVSALGSIAIDGEGTFLSNAVLSDATGTGGDVNLTANSLSVTNGGQIYAGTYGRGDAGNVNINLSGAASFDEIGDGISSGAYSRVEEAAAGNGGNVNLTAASLSITNGAALQASTYGRGNVGSVNVNVADTVILDGTSSDAEVFSSGIYNRVETLDSAVGQGGSINIAAGSLFLTNGAVITASTGARGNAGNLTVTVRDGITLDGIGRFSSALGVGQSSGLYSSVKVTAVGEGGNIRVSANSLSATNGAVVIANTFGVGNGGSIQINVNSVNLAGVDAGGQSSGIFTPTEPSAIGNAGEITINSDMLRLADGAVVSSATLNSSSGGNIAINARTLELVNGAQVLTTANRSGSAGNIQLNVSESISLSGSDRTFGDRLNRFGQDLVSNSGAASGIYANTSDNSTGAGGTLTVQTRQLTVRDGAAVTVSADGKGAAGNLTIAADSIRLDSGAIKATTQAGNFGNITLQAPDLQLQGNSQITTNAFGTATGGNIDINTKFLIAKENSDIRANAVRGRGGNIIITAEGIFQSLDSDIDASSELGIDGNVELRTPDTDPVKGLNQPEILGVPQAPAQTCQTRGQRTSRFVITGRGGLPPSPRERVSSEHNFEAVKEPIVEAQGWIINAKGEIELVANSAAVVPYSPGRAPVCH
ncbi:filamentous hemagglutinin N-terminal domain-containing protein [Tychonema sp. LEGE 07199]|uniref:two-partner secretion domain-containing protein n=1 Tax=unclassified Tychonema TaxID=2642144 RepID=UPI001880970E|nr:MULTISPECIES: filamentous hemagglutinin N-terminal domain-containing protein [unclassified Tychonema]MBE9123631.1 filamentous hemagglutinin N-terminal domain-containing protein [Tychonema sp. LEGE 07199]MBE9130847.1 filamentous hemagglutinin N-terminal domain-containing protein [Tychonema sp. LEGE 07196]